MLEPAGLDQMPHLSWRNTYLSWRNTYAVGQLFQGFDSHRCLSGIGIKSPKNDLKFFAFA